MKIKDREKINKYFDLLKKRKNQLNMYVTVISFAFPYDVRTNMLDRGIVVIEFELISRPFIYFQTNNP